MENTVRLKSYFAYTNTTESATGNQIRLKLYFTHTNTTESATGN
jgi:hypothetical protein